MKVLQEITEWRGLEYRQPNHVYLMDGDKAYAYVKWGEGQPEYFKTFLRIDRRGRRFREVPNRWRFRMDIGTAPEEEFQPVGQTWSVAGSKGNNYTVSLHRGAWSCTCPGHGFRNKCRHVDELRAQHS